MTERQRALLAPSAAPRWTLCPGSIHLARDVEDRSSPAAERGTAAQEVLNHWLHRLSRGKDFAKVSSLTVEPTEENRLTQPVTLDAEDLTALRIAHNEVARSWDAIEYGEKRLLLEHDVIPGASFKPDRSEHCYGTADIILIGGGVLEVADYKHGSGKLVEPDDPQIILYALGALKECTPAQAQEIRTKIIQPRYQGADPVRSMTWTPEQMADWRDKLQAIATRALDSPEPILVPGETQCRWCPAKANCPALRKHALEGAAAIFEEKPMSNNDSTPAWERVPPPGPGHNQPPQELTEATPESPGSLDGYFGLLSRSPDELDAQGLAAILEAEPLIRGWLNAVHEHAHKLMKAGTKVPGFKLVLGRASRSWSSEEEARKVFASVVRTKDHGGGKLKKSDYLDEKILSPAQAEKRLKPLLSARGWNKVKELIQRDGGKPVIALETDSRPEVVTDPARIFEPVEEKKAPDMSFLD